MPRRAINLIIMFRDQAITTPMIRWPPVILLTVGSLVGPAGYLAGTMTLEDVGLGIALMAFALAVYLSVVIEPDPPYDRIATTILLGYGFGFTFLAAPAYVPFGTIGDEFIIRALAAVALGLVVPGLWILYTALVARYYKQVTGDEQTEPREVAE